MGTTMVFVFGLMSLFVVVVGTLLYYANEYDTRKNVARPAEYQSA